MGKVAQAVGFFESVQAEMALVQLERCVGLVGGVLFLLVSPEAITPPAS